MLAGLYRLKETLLQEVGNLFWLYCKTRIESPTTLNSRGEYFGDLYEIDLASANATFLSYNLGCAFINACSFKS